MVDTGRNRLEVLREKIGGSLLERLRIDSLMSHLASANEYSARDELQRKIFAALTGRTSARRLSLANSAGIVFGRDFSFDLTRHGVGLFGGVPRPELGESSGR